MDFLDARRLTGPSLLFDTHGSVLDIACSAGEAERLVPVWKKHVAGMLAELGWRDAEIATARLCGGVSLGFSAPVDALYAASAINEWAWSACDHELNGTDAPDLSVALAGIRDAIEEEANPGLTNLEAQAAANDVTMLWDDDHVSLGLGRHSETWPVRELPDPETLDWARFRDVPTALVTGTNGKTTTVRLAAHILRAAHYTVGMSSTDCIAVDNEVIDRDDWSGPGGARHVLRHKAVDAAILETARGGLLRRGLGLYSADAAVITNIGRDHLGDFGSRSLDELMDIKWIVSRAVRHRGMLILNADDARLVERASNYPGALAWFSLQPANPVVASHVSDGGTAYVLQDGDIVRLQGEARERICAAADIPITLRGAARHNIANALAAAALAFAMGVTMADVRRGLATMTQEENPGRGNVFDVDGFRVIVDFAHNPQAIEALLDMAAAMQGKRKVLCFAQAGDRPDDLIRELARNAWEKGLDRVIVSELAHYYRGRGPGEVYGLIRDELLRCGAREDQIEHNDEEIESFESALAWAQPGDLVIMLALTRSAELYDRIGARSSGAGRSPRS
jgi:UDP-N-acetylmuramyl tripeptide synthase